MKNNKKQKKDKRIKVALYLPLGKRNASWSGLGGAEKRLSYLFSHMDKLRFDISIVFRFYEDFSIIKEKLGKYIADNCNVVFVASNKEAFFHFLETKYDCVFYDDYMVETKIGVIGALAAGSERILIFVTEFYARWSFRKKWHSFIMSQNVQMASRIDTLYPSSLTLLQKKFSSKPITITPCSLPYLTEYLKRNRSCTKENIMVFAGRLVSDKNPLLLLEAVKMLRQQMIKHKFHVWICGKGELEESILRTINHYRLEPCVEYKGIQNMEEVLPKAKVFFSLQNNENYPSQSLLEAIASGCYCIATDVGDTRRIVLPTFGTLVEKSPKAIAAAIHSAMLMNEIEYRNVSECAIQFAKTNFDTKVAVKHYESICESI